MEKRKLGNSGLAIQPLMFGGNVFGWTADEADVVPAARRLRRRRPQRHRHRRRLFAVGAGPPGRRVRDDPRQVAQGARGAGQGRHRHQGRQRDGAGQEGAVQGLHPAGRRGLAEAPADRLHRPLPVAHRRSRNAARGDARRLPEADRAGQGARHRLLQLHGAAAGRGAEDQRRPRSCRATSACSRTTTSTSGRASRRSWSRCA